MHGCTSGCIPVKKMAKNLEIKIKLGGVMLEPELGHRNRGQMFHNLFAYEFNIQFWKMSLILFFFSRQTIFNQESWCRGYCCNWRNPWQLNVQYSNIRTPININDNINIDIDPHLIRAPLNVNNVNPNFDFDCLRCKSRCTHETSFGSSNTRQSHRALDSI